MNSQAIFPPLLTFILFTFFIIDPAISAETSFKSFLNVRYIKNFDGDSITFDIPDTPSIVGKNMVIRVRGIDTPELHKSKCAAEKEKALRAKKRVHSLLKDATVINLHHIGRGKYFRILAGVEFDGEDLATLLLTEELAVKYSGGSRNHDWCDREDVAPLMEAPQPGILPPQVDGVYIWPPPPSG